MKTTIEIRTLNGGGGNGGEKRDLFKNSPIYHISGALYGGGTGGGGGG
jgi:hypothetical protein